MTPPQGMSAEERTDTILNQYRNTFCYFSDRWLQDWLTKEFVATIKQAEAAARSDERVRSEQDLAEMLCCEKCRKRIKDIHSRDARGGTYGTDPVRRVEASQERVRVKANNEALGNLIKLMQQIEPRKISATLVITYALGLRLSEPPRVDSSEGGGS